jgi:hypothetical protein
VVSDPYGSHVPFLTWIGQHVTPIRWVLELGAGQHSTPLWLNRSVFPQVERVVSVEQNEGWVPKVADSRLQVDVARFAEMLVTTHQYDLVFIDNGPTDDDRMRAIKAIMDMPRLPLVVLHDWEDKRYRDAAEGRYDWALTDDANPQTALLVRRSNKW